MSAGVRGFQKRVEALRAQFSGVTDQLVTVAGRGGVDGELEAARAGGAFEDGDGAEFAQAGEIGIQLERGEGGAGGERAGGLGVVGVRGCA